MNSEEVETVAFLPSGEKRDYIVVISNSKRNQKQIAKRRSAFGCGARSRIQAATERIYHDITAPDIAKNTYAGTFFYLKKLTFLYIYATIKSSG